MSNSARSHIIELKTRIGQAATLAGKFRGKGSVTTTSKVCSKLPYFAYINQIRYISHSRKKIDKKL